MTECISTPWRYGEDNDGWYLHHLNERSQLGYALKEDDARRIAAAVNACIGIPTEKLEQHWPKGGLLPCAEIHEAAEKAEQYKKQRDDLLAALLDISYKNDEGEYKFSFIEETVLNDFIAKAIEACEAAK